MFLFVCPRNYREKTGYHLIFLNILMFLMLPLFLTNLILPIRAMAQNGTISGRVYKYSNTSAVISGAIVTAYDGQGYQRGWDTTDSYGRYKIENLATGENIDYYKVCAVKKDYVRDCYQKPNSSDPDGCTGRDCGFYWKEEELRDPNEMLVDLCTKTSQSNINFYLVQGGYIAGKISGANPNYAYQVIFEGEVQYKNRRPVSSEIPLIKKNNNFHNDPNLWTIPPGNYTLRAEDASSALRYYSTVYYDGATGTYNPHDASILTYLLNKFTSKTANFTIRKGGIIWGQVFEQFPGYLVGISDAGVTITEKDYPLPSLNTKTQIVIDPNNGTVYEGAFYFSGLSPGRYIMKTDDSPIADANYRFYLPEYYNNVYFEEKATSIEITEESINAANYEGFYVQVILQHCPTIRGWVKDCDSQKALEDITIEIIPDFKPQHPELFKTTLTDPNGYIFKKTDKILPETYKIRAKDLNVQYFPTDPQTITLAAGKKYEVNFCMQKVPAGQGNGNISGHFFLNENPNLPLPGVLVGLYSTFGHPFKDTNTNENGEYFFNNIDPGEYILFTTEKLPGDLIHELYKDVCVLDPNKFEEGNKILESQAAFEAASTKIFLLPGENRTNVDIGLSSYKYTFSKGLNLFGYPGLPVEKYDDTYKFCEELEEHGSAMHAFRGKDPETGWYVVTTSNIQDDPKKLRTGDGYMIYMKNEAVPIFYPPFKTMPPEFYKLEPGINLIAYPSSLHRSIKRSSDLLNKLGTPGEVASVTSFDNTSGKWKSTVWLWNKPGAADFPIVQGEGYLVGMNVSKEVPTDPPYIDIEP